MEKITYIFNIYYEDDTSREVSFIINENEDDILNFRCMCESFALAAGFSKELVEKIFVKD